MELRHLRYFLAVAEELHFGRAAERLQMTQPPLSTQIRDLERELGVALFDRSGRQVRLTAAGTQLLPHARRVLGGAAHLHELAGEIAGGGAGRVRLGVVHSSMYGAVPALLRRFRDRYPQVRLVIREAVTSVLIEEVVEDHLDVAFIRHDRLPDGLARRTILDEPLLAVLPDDHPVVRRGDTEVRLTSLADDPVVLFPREIGTGFWDLILSAYRDAGVTPRIEHLADQVTTMVGMVAAGLGVSIVPREVRNVALRGVTYVPLTPTVELPLELTWREDHDLAALRSFVAVVGEGGG